jgi:hypothetical protein
MKPSLLPCLSSADELTALPGPMTEFLVSIQRPAIEHRIRLSQVSEVGGRQHQRRACGGYKATACEGPSGEPHFGTPEVIHSIGLDRGSVPVREFQRQANLP